MDELRWIILVFGVLLMVGIYFADRFKRRRRRKDFAVRWFDRDEASDFSMAPRPVEEGDYYQDALADLNTLLGEKRRFADADIGKRAGPATDADDDTSPTVHTGAAVTNESPLEDSGTDVDAEAHVDMGGGTAREERLLVLYLKAPGDHVFTGPVLFEALETAGLKLGGMGIYHDTNERNEILFSVANLFEPGTLDVDDVEPFTTRGLAMFMQLPGPADEAGAFERMLAKSELIAQRIGGELYDDRHEPLDRTAVERIRDTFIVS